MTVDQAILDYLSGHPGSTVSEIAAGVPTITKAYIFRHVKSLTRFRMLERQSREIPGRKDCFEYRVME